MDVRAQDLLDASEEPAALLDEDGALLAANDAWRAAPCLATPQAEDLLARLRDLVRAGEPRASRLYTAGDGDARREFRLDASRLEGAHAMLVRRIETTGERRAAERRESLAARLAALLDACADATLTIDALGTVREVNRAVTALFGYEPEEVVGRPIAMLLPAEAAQAPEDPLAALLGADAQGARGGALGCARIVEARRKDGASLPVSLAVREARTDGERLFVGLMRDVSEAQRQREALDRSTLGFELALEAGGLGWFDLAVASRALAADARFRAAFGLAGEVPLTCADVEARLTEEDASRLAAQLRTAIGGGLLDVETRVCLPAGEERFVALRGRLVRRGAEAHVVGVVADITERKRAEADRLREERDRYVIGEMRHRIKNLFTMVGAVLNLSVRGHGEALPFKRAVESRLAALEAAQTRLAESGWRTSRLDDIVAAALEPFHERGHRNRVAGCDLVVDGHAAQVLAMIVHELATNAAKHGALSVAGGRVDVLCAREGDAVVLTWAEEGGPPVGAPTHRGFGTTVTVRMAERFLGARVETRFDRPGFRYRLEIPAARVLHAG